MSESNQLAHRVARIVSFSTLGALSMTQDLVRAVLSSIEGADPELVAEETLCLVAAATGRAVEVGLREDAAAVPAVVSTLLEIPFLYRDYLIGGGLLAQEAPELSDEIEEVYSRLRRKQEFYTVHLPPGQFPGERVLTDKMGLWMGRVSPPRLPQLPTDRLQSLGLVPVLHTHLRLVSAYARQGGGQ